MLKVYSVYSIAYSPCGLYMATGLSIFIYNI
jgi:hypothetical protein